MKQYLSRALAVAMLTLGSASTTEAANLSFAGNLAGDNAVQLFNFTLAVDADVELRTWSYAGGTNGAGSLIGAGGFDPIVSLYYGTGDTALLIGANDDGTGVAVDPGTGLALDSLLQVSALPIGTYTVALTQVANFANGPTLGDGFLGSGNPGFDGRTAAWALDIRGVASAAPIPEPGTLTLALLGLAAVGTLAAAMRPSRLQRWLRRPARLRA